MRTIHFRNVVNKSIITFKTDFQNGKIYVICISAF